MRQPDVISFYGSLVGPNRITVWQRDEFYLRPKTLIRWCVFTWFDSFDMSCKHFEKNAGESITQYLPASAPACIHNLGSEPQYRQTHEATVCATVTRLFQWFCLNTPPLTFLATAKNEMFVPVTLSAVCQGGISPQLCFPGNLLDGFSVRRGALSYNLFWFVLCLFFLIAGIVTIWQIYLV